MRHVRQEKFKEYDQVREFTEGMYVDTLVKFNEQIARLEHIEKRVVQSIERDSIVERENVRGKSTESSKQPHSTTNSSETEQKSSVQMREAQSKRNQSKVKVQSIDDELNSGMDIHFRSDTSEKEKSPKVKSKVVKADHKPETGEFEQKVAEWEVKVKKWSDESRALLERAARNEKERDVRRARPTVRVSVPEPNKNDSYATTPRAERRYMPYERPPVTERLGRTHETLPVMCNNCKCMHKMKDCPQLLRMSYDERWERVHNLNVCQNCFIPLHMVRRPHRCPHGNCHVCNEFHNSRLCRHSKV